MATSLEETGLATRTEQSYELAPTAGAAEKQFEIQSAVILARRFPRNEEKAYASLMRAAERTSFAENASYRFPRGKVKNSEGRWVQNFVTGPSVHIAREFARIWGNIRYGLEVIREDEDSRQIRGWAWDLETNVKVTAEDEFKKLVQRKTFDRDSNTSATNWVTADERELRELTNRRGAILVRNCILQLLPSDYIEEAREQCDRTLEAGAEKDPDSAKKKIIVAFGAINITPDMLEAKLGHRLAECSPKEVAELRMIYKSIADGNSSWADYVEKPKAEPEKASIGLDDVKPSAAENRGHGNEGLSQVSAPSPQEAQPQR